MLPTDPKHNKQMQEAALRRLQPMMIRAAINQMSNVKVAPDTIGVDYFFILSFLNQQMEDDFPLIEQEFLKNCRTKLDEFNDVGSYGAADILSYNPIQSLHANILRLIYNGAKIEDAYCLELIKTLYKTYHKKEYNQLKRFKKLTGDDIINLAENYDSIYTQNIATARILGMCNFLGIEIDEKCSIFYYSLNEERELHLSALEKHTTTDSISKELYDECAGQVESWISESRNKGLSTDDISESYYEAFKFVGESFKQRGFAEDYMQLCTAADGSRVMSLINTLALLKKLNPKKNYSLSDVQRYSIIDQLITAFTDIVYDYDYEVGFLLGDELDEIELENILFNPSQIDKTEKLINEKPIKLVNSAPIGNETASKEDIIKELDDLRGRYRDKDEEVKHVREKYRTLSHSTDELTKRIQSLEAEHEDLIKLREFVYSLENDNDSPNEETLSKMAEVIADRKIVIIGGHQNWHNKLKKQFPKWSFIHMDEFKTVTVSMLEKYDKVYFYSDYLSHKSFYKCIGLVRNNNIPYGYLHGVNPEITIKQIYETIC